MQQTVDGSKCFVQLVASADMHRCVVTIVPNGYHQSLRSVQCDAYPPDIALWGEATNHCTDGWQVVVNLKKKKKKENPRMLNSSAVFEGLMLYNKVLLLRPT